MDVMEPTIQYPIPTSHIPETTRTPPIISSTSILSIIKPNTLLRKSVFSQQNAETTARLISHEEK